ncbi:MAG: type II toxin-antitoxin system toxin DNA ADP-ribosyl transferase DarT [Fluviicola sp.]
MGDVNKLYVFRIIHFQNLDFILQNGIYYRNSEKFDPNYINIGSAEVITRRDRMYLKCYPETRVNECVPFYFGFRSPMLYKIKTGHGVPQFPQDEIIYLVCNFREIVDSELTWCFTDGNAASSITEFYNDVNDLDKLDWNSIYSTEWSDDNSDGDHDRMRKKQAEVLVKDYVPISFVKAIVVLSETRKKNIENLLQKHMIDIKVFVDDNFKYYYP